MLRVWVAWIEDLLSATFVCNGWPGSQRTWWWFQSQGLSRMLEMMMSEKKWKKEMDEYVPLPPCQKLLRLWLL